MGDTTNDLERHDTSMTEQGEHPVSEVDRNPVHQSLASRGVLGWARLAAVFGLVVLARLAFSFNRTFFNLSPDEPAMMGIARWISGSGHWNMFNMSTWRPGFPTLIAPLFLLSDDQDAIFQGALTVNAVLGGVGACLLALIVVRMTSLTPTLAAIVAVMVSVMPASLSASAHAWAEPSVTVCFLAAVWYTLRYMDEPGPRFGMYALLWALIGFTIHTRLLMLLLTVFGLVVGRALALRRWKMAALFSGTAAILAAASEWYSRMVVNELWETPTPTNTVGSVLDQLASPIDVLDAVAGQAWYLLASSLLFVGVGAIEVLRAAGRRAKGPLSRVDALVLVALTLPLLALSATFVSGRDRSDQLVYGRYNDGVVWPLIAIGVAWLITTARSEPRRTQVWIVGGLSVLTLELGFLLQQFHGPSFDRTWGLGAMIPGVSPLAPSRTELSVAAIGVISVAIFLGLVVVALRPPAKTAAVVLVAGLVVLLSVGALRTHEALGRRLNGGQESAIAVEEIAEFVPEGSTLGVRFIPDFYRPSVPSSQQEAVALFYEWALPQFEFRIDRGSDDVGPYVFSPDNDPLFRAAEAEPLWNDPFGRTSLWLEDD